MPYYTINLSQNAPYVWLASYVVEAPNEREAADIALMRITHLSLKEQNIGALCVTVCGESKAETAKTED